MKIAVYGPNLPSQDEAFHIHVPDCREVDRRVYRDQQPRLVDKTTIKDLVVLTYDPVEFEYDPTTEWKDYAQDFKICRCAGKFRDYNPKEEQVSQPTFSGLGEDVESSETTGSRLEGPAKHVKAFALEHADDKRRRWDVVADDNEWPLERVIKELENSPAKIRSDGGARRHFDTIVHQLYRDGKGTVQPSE